MSAPLRIGSVPYLVGRPLDSGLEDEPGIDFVRQVPRRLVEGLRAGELDVALVSSIELFRRPGYRYLDRLAVIGSGAVGSVQVFLKRPLAEVRTLALDPASRTAASLVRVLLEERAGGRPEFLTLEPGEDPAQCGADAWLRIGDDALRETLAGENATFNPSEEWTRITRLPFVFAAWIVRPDVAIEPHLDAFVRAHRRGTERIAELAERAAREWGLPLEACRHYLENECEYEAQQPLSTSLLAFRDAAARLELCDPDLTPDPIELPHAALDR